MRRTAFLITTLAMLAAASVGCGSDTQVPAVAESPPFLSHERLTAHEPGRTDAPLGYWEYLPPAYGDEPAPLLIALHGSNGPIQGHPSLDYAMGGDNLPDLIQSDEWPEDRPFVVLAPLHVVIGDRETFGAACKNPMDATCAFQFEHDIEHDVPHPLCHTPDEVHDFIAFAVEEYDVDPARVYLTGLSCGAYATYEYLFAHGDTQIAAAVPISGEARPAFGDLGCALVAVPIWAFHGRYDDVIPVEATRKPLRALGACDGGPEARLTEIATGHDAWAQVYDGTTYGGEDIYTWLLEQQSLGG